MLESKDFQVSKSIENLTKVMFFIGNSSFTYNIRAFWQDLRIDVHISQAFFELFPRDIKLHLFSDMQLHL